MWNKLKQWLHPDHITRGSIKEGFDDLPAAVCYFTPDGIIRLCNRQMFRVYRALSGRDLQSLEELHQQVWAPTHGRRVDGKNPSFVLPDGTCWLYSEQTVFGEGVRPHVECIFSEVTDLQRQRQELLRQNQELLRMNRELRRLSENVQEMTRENMEHLVEDSGRYRRVASLSTAEMALAQCARHTVDLVLMDVCTKGSRDGIDVAAEIKARYPETKVIIITSMVEESYLKRAKAAGAESFWYKDVSPESLLEVMDRTMAGESLYPDRTPETRLGQVSSTQLTPREIEVLRLVCEGLEYEEIAAELGISSRTVKRFVSSLLEKTGYSNRTRLAIAVTKKNFILPHLEE